MVDKIRIDAQERETLMLFYKSAERRDFGREESRIRQPLLGWEVTTYHGDSEHERQPLTWNRINLHREGSQHANSTSPTADILALHAESILPSEQNVQFVARSAFSGLMEGIHYVRSEDQELWLGRIVLGEDYTVDYSHLLSNSD